MTDVSFSNVTDLSAGQTMRSREHRDSPARAEVIAFETRRLRLRQWRESDRAPFAQLNADPRVMQFFPALLNRAASDAMADRCEALIEARGWGFWAVEVKSTGAFVGFVGLHIPHAALPFIPCVEIGWRLAYPYWGQGLATEAARGALRFGFEQLQLAEILAFTALLNLRSQAVMGRLGMQAGDATFHHPDLSSWNPLREHCLYRLSRDQWLQWDRSSKCIPDSQSQRQHGALRCP